MHKDKRGMIKDLLVGKDFSVTHITFKKGAIRGNHLHKKTTQIDLVLNGKLNLVANLGSGCENIFLGREEKVIIGKKVSHAYKALEDSEMVSICFGKRIGDNYSKDTYALQEKLIEN